jgi:predicted amidohydrolase YtcJ
MAPELTKLRTVTRTLLTAGHVLAGDPPREGARAVLVKDDRIAWVADPSELRERVSKKERVDLGDAWVMPGLIDPHFHLSAYAVLPGWVDVTGATTVRQLAAALLEGAASAPEGTWVVGWGCRELVTGLDLKLTREVLDAAVPERPCLVVHSSFHSGVANSAALARVGFGRTTPRAPGGELERDIRGEPNGRVWERAFTVMEWAARRAELDALGDGWGDRVGALSTQFLSEGLTHVGDASMSPREIELAQKTSFPFGLTAMPASGASMLGRVDDVLEGPRTGEGDAHLRIGPVKLFADGAERCALFLPYPIVMKALRGLATGPAGPGGPIESLRIMRPRFDRHGVHTGMLHWRGPILSDAMARASKAGFGVAVHALGNEAVSQTLWAYERARVYGARIEHAMFTTQRDADRMAKLGITAVIQPGHVFSYGVLVATTGLDEYLPPVPARRLLDAGVKVSLSSDGPTALWEPLRILRLAVDRRTEEGLVIRPDQALTREEALRAATVGAADAAGVGDVKGEIAPGKLADLLVLSGDPFDEHTRVLQTWIGGKKVWEGDPWPTST